MPNNMDAFIPEVWSARMIEKLYQANIALAVVANTDYVGDGYGIPTPGGMEAIAMFAELEGILLDPVYSAKGAAGLIDLIRKGRFKKGERVVFLHTGGAAALFGYTAAFDFSERRIQAASAA